MRVVVVVLFILVAGAGIAGWAVATLVLRWSRLRCGVCFGWDLRLRRPRVCPQCAHDKARTRDDIRHEGGIPPPESTERLGQAVQRAIRR